MNNYDHASGLWRGPRHCLRLQRRSEKVTGHHIPHPKHVSKACLLFGLNFLQTRSFNEQLDTVLLRM